MVGTTAVFAVPVGFIPTDRQGCAGAVSGQDMWSQEGMALVLSTAQLGKVPGDTIAAQFSHGGAQPWGLGAAGLSPSPRLCHPQGDPAKRGRGEREAKRFFFLFSRCFIMGLLVPKKCFESIR